MHFQVFLVCFLIVFIVIALYKELFRPVIVFMIATVLMLFSGIISPKEALTGFSNDQVAVIFVLLVISEIIQKTGTLDVLLNRVFSQRLGYRSFLTRMTFSVGGASAFVNNTPVVAILMPYVYAWSRRKGISPSRVLIPLSYAAIIGGTITLVGTSTNLVVNALAVEASHGNPDIVPLRIFDFSPVGLPLLILGSLYIVWFGARRLPVRKDPLEDFEEKTGEYLVETHVPHGSSYAGKTVDQAMRNLKSVFLVEAYSNGERLSPVNPTHVIHEGDILLFAGATGKIIDIINDPKELSLPEYTSVPDHEKTEVVEVVVSANSFLKGKKVRDTSFRGLYDAAIVAIKRDGERIDGSIGEVILRTGDLLLLIAGNDFTDRVRETKDLHVVAKVRELRNIDKRKTLLVGISVLSAFVLSGFTSLGLFKAMLIPIIIITLLKMIRMEDLKNSIDVDLFLILVMALAIGKGITNSGAADLFARGLIGVVEPLRSPMAALAGVYLLTNVLAMVVTSKAAVAITFPVTMAMVEKLRMGIYPDLPYTPFMLAIAFAGCAEFMTPYGYQTNLMVYGPGGYKLKDYLRFGTPLTVLFIIVAVLTLGWLYGLV